MNKIILGLKVQEKKDISGKLQEIFTKFGCSIKTRIGLNETNSQHHATGIIILECCGDMEQIILLENELKKIENLELQKMNFNFNN